LASVLEPDDRQPNLGQSLADLHAGLSTLELHDRVPADVRQLFETAKNVRLYTYFVYRFHQVTEMVAYQALERGLKHRWNAEVAHLASIDDTEYVWPGLGALMADAGQRNWVRNEGFRGRRWRAARALLAERSIEASKAMAAAGVDRWSTPDPTEDEIDQRVPQIDVVAIMVALLPKLRNQLAHGSARLAPTSDLVLQDICDALNMIFDGTPSTPTPKHTHARMSMHGAFKRYLAQLELKRVALISMEPVTRDSLPEGMPERGVYLFTENGQHKYVGRSNGLYERIRMHSAPGSDHNRASLAFKLARQECGIGPPTYRKGTGRAEIACRPDMKLTFPAVKARIGNMEVRFVEEADSMKQMLLEAYVHVVHKTPYNDFDNH
jgi:hypothetical protein